MLLLYSTNTLMAYGISEQHYGGSHWVWCSPFFKPDATAAAAMPETAVLALIYSGFRRAVYGGDLHSAWIERNKAGLTKGVEAKRAAGAIDDRKVASLIAAIDAAPIINFRPLLFIIPYAKVKKQLEEVPPHERANPISIEYRILSLSRKHFDVLEFPEV